MRKGYNRLKSEYVQKGARKTSISSITQYFMRLVVALMQDKFCKYFLTKILLLKYHPRDKIAYGCILF